MKIMMHVVLSKKMTTFQDMSNYYWRNWKPIVLTWIIVQEWMLANCVYQILWWWINYIKISLSQWKIILFRLSWTDRYIYANTSISTDLLIQSTIQTIEGLLKLWILDLLIQSTILTKEGLLKRWILDLLIQSTIQTIEGLLKRWIMCIAFITTCD